MIEKLQCMYIKMQEEAQVSDSVNKQGTSGC